jgi:hypothetical protein
MMPSTGKKEPEDIFASLDTGGEKTSASGPVMEEAPRRSPLKAILGLVVGLAVIAGIGFAVWYFLIRSQAGVEGTPTTTSQTPTVVPTEPSPVVEVPPSVPIEPVTEPVVVPPTGTNVPPPVVEPTPALTPAVPGIDRDADGLTDAEEVIFGTDALVADTDGDGYSDGAEAKSGYDPAVAKGSLTASTRFKTIRIGTFASAMIPSNWTDEGAAGTRFINPGTAESFRITERSLADKPADMMLADWFASDAGVATASLRGFRTRGGFDAWQTEDGRTAYVVIDVTILVIKYDSGTSVSAEFRSLYSLFIDSLTRM